MRAVAIVGRGPSWKDFPFAGEAWGSLTCLEIPELREYPFSKLFKMDTLDIYDNTKWFEMAKARNIPVMMRHGENGAEIYPYEEVVRDLHSNFLLNTPSLMIAYALWKGYDLIKLYGIDQDESPFIAFNSCIQFWIGMARGMALAKGRDPWDALQLAPSSRLIQGAEKLEKKYV